MPRFPSSKKGFTLIELLVAMTIVGILSVIGLSAYLGVQGRARDIQRLDDAKKIITALEQYKSADGKYPLNASGWLESTDGNCNWLTGIDTSNFKSHCLPNDPLPETPWTADCNTTSLKELRYYYQSNSAGDDYCLQISQENNASGHPYYRTYSCNSWKLRFGPKGAHAGGCNTW